MGFVVVMVMLFGTVQLLFRLHATTAVTAAAHDAARAVAGYAADGARCASTDAATERLRRDLGRYGELARVEVEWRCGADVVEVRVVAHHPTALPDGVGRRVGLGPIDRTVQVRPEGLR